MLSFDNKCKTANSTLQYYIRMNTNNIFSFSGKKDHLGSTKKENNSIEQVSNASAALLRTDDFFCILSASSLLINRLGFENYEDFYTKYHTCETLFLTPDSFKKLKSAIEATGFINNLQIVVLNHKNEPIIVHCTGYRSNNNTAKYYDIIFDFDFANNRTISQKQSNERLFNMLEMVKVTFFDYYYDHNTIEWIGNINKILNIAVPLNNFDAIVTRFLTPDNLTAQNLFYQLKANKIQNFDAVFKLANDDHKTETIHISVKNINNSGNLPIKAEGWIKNISESSNARATLLSALRMNEEILKTIPVSVFWKDCNLKYLGCNEKFAKDAGLIRDEIIGKTDSELCWLKEESDIFNADDKFIIESNEPQLNYEETLTKANGEEVWLRTSKTPLHSPEGNIIGVLGTYLEITDLKKAQLEIIKEKNRAEESDRLKTAFLANMSHEIRTPLSAIIGFADMLTNNEVDSSETAYFTQTIKIQADYLLRIVSDILDISIIESGQLQLQIGPIWVEPVLKDTFKRLEQQLNKRAGDIRAKYRVPEQCICKVEADEVRLRQVLSILIDNAVKFTPIGTVEIGIKGCDEKSITIYVKDTGIGIHHDKKELIFECFRKANESVTRKHGGLGLGLSIAKEVVERMNGKIWFESEVNAGSTFYFTLPKAQISPKSDQPIIKKDAKVAKTHGKILVVDDFKHIHQLMRMMLEKKGIQALSALTGEMALEIASSEPDIDVIFLDIQMPDLDGIEILNTLRANNNQVPVVAFTAFAMNGDRETFLGQGFNDYLAKPMDVTELERIIAKFVPVKDIKK